MKKASKQTVFSVQKQAESPFIKELESIRCSDLPVRRGVYERKSTKKLLMGAFRYFMLTLSTLVFVASCSALVLYAMDYINASNENEFYKNIFRDDSGSLFTADNKTSANMSTLSIDRSHAGEVMDVDYTQGTYNEEYENIKTKILALKRYNSDIWGWITVPGTDIDFPIMFSGDNEYYLTHSVSKENNKNGAIFADGRTEEHLEDNKNLIVYGHNMSTTGIMFSQLVDYTREDIFNSRPVIISTLDGIYTYEVFSIYSTVSTYNYIRTYFGNSEHFLSFVDTCRQKSLYSKDITFSASDKLLTLSTCTNMRDNKRWAIHAKLVSISK